MDLSEQSLHGLIDFAYEAAEHPGRWHALYEALRRAVGVKSVHVLALDKRHAAMSYSDGANLPTEGELAYLQHYRFIDPRLPMVLASAPEAWLHFPQDLPPDVAVNHPVYQEFLLPYDRGYASVCKLADTPDATVIFSTLSGQAEGPLQPQAIAFLDRLLPHLRRACRIGIRNFVYSTHALVGHLLVDKMRQPVILVSPEGAVIHANTAAQQLLRATRLVQVRDGTLHLPDHHGAELLQHCAEVEQSLKSAAATPEAREDAMANGCGSLRIIGEQPAETLYAFFTVLSPQGAMGTFGLRPVVMLMFYHPASAPSIDSSLLYAVFGLTPVEARVATLLAEGMSPKQIAEVHGTQHDTVRKQLRSIYQKTATKRQPELMRLLLHLPHNAVQR